MTTQPSATPEPYAHEWQITVKADEHAGAIDALFNCIRSFQSGAEPIGGTCPRSMGNRMTYDVEKVGREGRDLELTAWQDRCSAAEIARDAAQLVLNEERKELAAARAECERLKEQSEERGEEVRKLGAQLTQNGDKCVELFLLCEASNAELARLRAEVERLTEDMKNLNLYATMWKQEKARAERAEAESAGRLKVLNEKAEELRAEWLRAERAEAQLAAIKSK